MNDAVIANIGRNLAEALARCAYERDVDSAKAVAVLQTELCAAVRSEHEAETKKNNQEATGEESNDRTSAT
jgi:hypothetical protein